MRPPFSCFFFPDLDSRPSFSSSQNLRPRRRPPKLAPSPSPSRFRGSSLWEFLPFRRRKANPATATATEWHPQQATPPRKRRGGVPAADAAGDADASTEGQRAPEQQQHLPPRFNWSLHTEVEEGEGGAMEVDDGEGGAAAEKGRRPEPPPRRQQPPLAAALPRPLPLLRPRRRRVPPPRLRSRPRPARRRRRRGPTSTSVRPGTLPPLPLPRTGRPGRRRLALRLPPPCRRRRRPGGERPAREGARTASGKPTRPCAPAGPPRRPPRTSAQPRFRAPRTGRRSWSRRAGSPRGRALPRRRSEGRRRRRRRRPRQKRPRGERELRGLLLPQRPEEPSPFSFFCCFFDSLCKDSTLKARRT